MSEQAGNTRAVFCSAEKLILPQHLQALRGAVDRVHRATILSLLLLNLHLRSRLESADAEITAQSQWADLHLKDFFNRNWIIKAFQEVTIGGGNASVDDELHETRLRHLQLDGVDLPSRKGLKQCMMYSATAIAAAASNNVWMHFHKRVEGHVKWVHKLPHSQWITLTNQQKKERVLQLKLITRDMCRMPHEAFRSEAVHHGWVTSERDRLGIATALRDADQDTNLLYQLKVNPHRFIHAMAVISSDKELTDRSAFSLYPLRRTMVPRYAHFDQTALREVLRLGGVKRDKAKDNTNDDMNDDTHNDTLGLPPLCAVPSASAALTAIPISATEEPKSTAPVRKRRKKNEMVDEKAELFARVLDLKKAGVHQRDLFEFSFRTDGVGAFVLMRKPRHETAEQALKRERQRRFMPKQGFWTEEQLRSASGLTLSKLAVIGIDPGKYDIIHCVDMDSPTRTLFRYTSAERRHDLRTQKYAARMQALKPLQVIGDEITLAQCNSRTADLVAFTVYCTRRVSTLGRSLGFYGDLEWRRHRRNVYIHRQKSEERLFRRFELFRANRPDRLMVLAYGSWGMKTGKMPMRGLPPTIGVGLLRKLARRFVVCVTPERNTSQTCSSCGGKAFGCQETEALRQCKIRGLRRCTMCLKHLGRDRNAACNIGRVFAARYNDQIVSFQTDPLDTAIEEADCSCE